ncbi:MAG: glycosyltransferase [Algibacter sp.]
MKVLQLIDSLHPGGAERIAVNLANELSSNIGESFLCVTREEGILNKSIVPEVNYLFLNKTKSVDFKAIRYLNNYIKRHQIDVIHAHSTSFFLASIIKLFNIKLKIIWHDHNGNRPNTSFKNKIVLKLCSLSFSTIISVNQKNVDWLIKNIKHRRIENLPNFVVKDKVPAVTKLFGKSNKRIVCLANLRPEKEHLDLIEAFTLVLKKHPNWTLHLIGNDLKNAYSKLVFDKIEEYNLNNHVFVYGSKSDISNILEQSSIGVLTSSFEGLPLSLLEYGLSNLPVVTTKVGACEILISNNINGILVEVNNYKAFSDALSFLIKNPDKSNLFARRFNSHIKNNYSINIFMRKILKIYKTL